MLPAAAGLVAGAYVCLGSFVLRPVRQLVRHVQWIRQCGDFNKRIGSRGADEVGTLAAEFDLLLAQLARSRATRSRSDTAARRIGGADRVDPPFPARRHADVRQPCLCEILR